MPRLLLMLGVIAAASVCGIWVQATRAPVPDPVRAAVPAERIESAAIEAPAVTKPRGRTVAPVTSTARPRLRSAMTTEPQHTGHVLTVEEMQNLARREAEGLVTTRNADGSETLNHEGRFREYTIIRVGPDGKPVVSCVHGEAALKHAMEGK